MITDGSNQVNLTNNTGYEQVTYTLSWSPNSSKIAARITTGTAIPEELYLVNADSSGITNVSNTATASDYTPYWSPVGNKIVFSSQYPNGGSNSDKNTEIFVINTDGTGLTQLTNTTPTSLSPYLQNYNPKWSPDGSKIVFETNRDGNSEIYIINSDGTGETRLTNNTSYDNEPWFSPDGTQVIFSSDGDMYKINVDGSSLTRLTTTGNDYFPRWK